MKKRNLLSVLLGLCLLMAIIFCFPTEARAAVVMQGNCGFEGNNLKWTLDDEGTLTISGTGRMSTYSFWKGMSEIKKVVIEEGATGISSNAFQNCDNLTSVSIPSSVTSIGDSAFYDCDSLTSITIPAGVTTISDRAFYSCDNLTDMTFSANITSMGQYVFTNCNNLTNLTITEGVTTIIAEAFAYCSNLKKITIPASVTSIGEKAFNNNGILKNAGVYITDLEAWCRITFEDPSANPLYAAKNLYINGVLATDIVIPESITVIKEHTFHNCDSLESVTFPKNLTDIEAYAFHDANSLKSIIFPGSIDTIGFAFGGCTNLEKVDVYDVAAWCQVTYTDTMGSPFACSSAAKLYINGELATKVVIPNGVTIINKHAFYSLEELEEVIVPKGLLQIASDAFYKCDNIKTVYHKGSEADWETIYGYWVFGDAEVIHDYVSPTHSWDAGVETQAPTCKEAGIKTFTCTVCRETKTEEIAKLTNHSYDEGVETTAPTCKEAGVKTFTCTVCDDSYTAEIAKSTQHTFADGACTVCGESDPDYVAPADPEKPADPTEPTDPTEPEEEEPLGFFEAIAKFFQDIFKILFFFLYL